MTELTLEQLKFEVEAIYKPLVGKTFKGFIQERNTTAVYTGGPRDIVTVCDVDVCELMAGIVEKIEKVSRRFEPGKKVWKGIVNDTLWVKSYGGDGDDTTFTVDAIEVLTDLNWQIPYKALVNITLA